MKETRTPEVLTVNGRAELVMMDAESYHDLVDWVRHMETLTAIREGIASAERGEMKDAEQVLTEMKAKYGIQG
jgi:predicted transcriptional regulator